MAKSKREKAPKSDRSAADFDNQNLEPEFAVADSKITVRRDGGKVVVSVPVRFYRRNGRQMILADSIDSESDLDESGLPNNALLTAIAPFHTNLFLNLFSKALRIKSPNVIC